MSDSLDTLRTEGPDPDLEARALGHWALSEAGVEAPGGLVTVASSPEASRVPYGRRADWIIVPSGAGARLAPLASVPVEPGENLAGEERDNVRLQEPGSQITVAPDALWLRGALVRAVLMAGALEEISRLSLSHARERHQFGRPIGTFQAVQAHLVAIAQQAALVAVAVEAAVARQEAFEIASAKLLAGRAAITATRAAHQVHGAVGVTRAHPLSVQTRRLWAWRCEYGDEQLWAEILGDAVRHGGADSLYPTITAGSREGRP